MSDQEELDHLQRQLARYRRARNLLEERAASAGGEPKLEIKDYNDLHDTREMIIQIEAKIAVLESASNTDTVGFQTATLPVGPSGKVETSGRRSVIRNTLIAFLLASIVAVGLLVYQLRHSIPSLPEPIYATGQINGAFSKVVWSTNLEVMRLNTPEGEPQGYITSENWLHMTNRASIEAGIYYGYVPPNGTQHLSNGKKLYYDNPVCPDGCIDYVIFWAEHTPNDQEEYFHVVASEAPNFQELKTIIELDALNNEWKVDLLLNGISIGGGVGSHIGGTQSKYSEFGGEYRGSDPKSCAETFTTKIQLYDLMGVKLPPFRRVDGTNIKKNVMNGTPNQEPGVWLWNKPRYYSASPPCPDSE